MPPVDTTGRRALPAAHQPPPDPVPPRPAPGARATIALDRARHPLVTYGAYPAMALFAVGLVTLTINRGGNRAAAAGLAGFAVIVASALLEWRHPLRPEWRMTKRSFFRRDAPFLVSGLVIDRAAELAAAVVVAAVLPETGIGPVAALPLVAQVAVALLAFDLGWYHYHRLAHRGGRLWRVHGAHHSPGQLYVFMHGVFHPFDVVVVRFAMTALLFGLTGVSSDATFLALTILGLQATVSHLNADLRLGPLNRLLAGPETHRYHHSAEFSGNYGSVTTVWDQAFGTFHYDPTHLPARLGLFDPTTYPDPEHFLRVLAWPFRSARAGADA